MKKAQREGTSNTLQETIYYLSLPVNIESFYLAKSMILWIGPNIKPALY